MYSKVLSGALNGLEGILIHTEVDVSNGLPMLYMVGDLAPEVKEAKERVRTALKNSSFILPPKRITVNLAPADIRKEGTAFDLSIAIGILVSMGIISQEVMNSTIVIGELSLNGEVNKINGILPLLSSMSKFGIKRCILPKANSREGAIVEEIEVIGVSSLAETVSYLQGNISLIPVTCQINEHYLYRKKQNLLDYADVCGQELVKRSIEVAVAGHHNLLMIGEPGSGKSMLAQRIPSIMPTLTLEESLEISQIHSVAGRLNQEDILVSERPFRAPHHTITSVALVGGGKNAMPGEVSLASGGVLFLDELPEYSKHALETLRQPLEERRVEVTRLGMSCIYPSNTMLVAAMNPCPCGYYPDMQRCTCGENNVQRYLNKISRPFLDRMDICIETSKIQYAELQIAPKGEKSERIRERVLKARKIQELRYVEEGILYNAQLTPQLLQKYCILGRKEKKLLEQAYQRMNMTARAYHRILKVARTIADLEEKETITENHISEAICYRGMDQKYWGSLKK